MKFRNGFVSNSSSSSFIIGVGRIKDSKIKEFKQWYNEILRDIDGYCVNQIRMKSTAELLSSEDDYWIEGEVKKEGKEVTVVAPVNSSPEVGIKFDPDKDEDYFIVCLGNDEGDCAFEKYIGTDFWDLDYSIVDDDYFSGYQAKLIEMFKNKEFFEEVVYQVGADRNG